MKQKIISPYQFSLLLITFLLGTIIIICPEIIIAGQNAWLIDIVAIALGVGSIILLVLLHYPKFNNNIIELADKIGGPGLRIIVGIIYTIYSIHLGSLNLRLIGNFLSTTIMPNMPILVFTLILTLVSAYAVTMDIKTIARVGQIIFPTVIFIFTLLLAFAIPEYQVNNLLPFEFKITNLLQGGFVIWAFPVGNLILFSFLFPNVKFAPRKNKTKEYIIYLMAGLLISGLILTLRTISVTMALGSELASSFTYPVFSMVSIIEVGDFLERLEPAFLTMWIGAAFINILICYWIAVESLTTLTKSKNKNSFIFSIGIILVSLAQILFKNYSIQYQFSLHTWPYYATIFILIIPIIILILRYFKKFKRN